MPEIKNIIFDLGGVILEIDIPKTKAAMKAIGVDNLDEFFGIGYADGCFEDHELGIIDDQQFLSALSRLAGKRLADEKLIEAWNAMLIRFPPERIRLLQGLSRRFRIFLFSNTNGIHHRAFNDMFKQTFGGSNLDSLFEKAYYSHLIGLRKPHKKAFEYILKDKHLNPGETLFIDDAMPNIKGAREAGLQTIFLEGTKTLLDIDWEKL